MPHTPRPACFSVPVCLYFCSAVSPDACPRGHRRRLIQRHLAASGGRRQLLGAPMSMPHLPSPTRAPPAPPTAPLGCQRGASAAPRCADLDAALVVSVLRAPQRASGASSGKRETTSAPPWAAPRNARRRDAEARGPSRARVPAPTCVWVTTRPSPSRGKGRPRGQVIVSRETRDLG